jgi:flagellar basal-body rod modification protein FlgD
MSTIDNYIDQTTIAPKVKTYGNTELDQNDFLKLLSAQLQHQDPMEPMENGEFIAEMAQFSALEESKNLTSAFQDLSTTLLSSGSLQASLLVGKSVSYNTDRFIQTSATTQISAKTELPGEFNIKITDEAGKALSDENVTSFDGSISYTYEGDEINNGNIFSISITNVETGELVQPQITDKVRSVDVSGTDISIKLSNGTQIGRSDLVEIMDDKEI